MQSNQPSPILINNNLFRAALISGILAFIIAGGIHLSYSPLHCTQIYYQNCEFEDYRNFICFTSENAYCCHHQNN